MKLLCIISICLTSLLLLAYPLVIMANVMTLANLPSGGPMPKDMERALTLFMWGSSLYPVAYLISLVASIWHLWKKNVKKAFFWQAGLIGYLILVAGVLLCS